jgi:hypothetical protein
MGPIAYSSALYPLFLEQECAGMKDTPVSCSSLQYKIYFDPNLYF